jgi:hypothetical protein
MGSRAPSTACTLFCSTIVFSSRMASSTVSFFERRKLPFRDMLSGFVRDRVRPIENGEGLLNRRSVRILPRELQGRAMPGISSSNRPDFKVGVRSSSIVARSESGCSDSIVSRRTTRPGALFMAKNGSEVISLRRLKELEADKGFLLISLGRSELSIVSRRRIAASGLCN